MGDLYINVAFFKVLGLELLPFHTADGRVFVESQPSFESVVGHAGSEVLDDDDTADGEKT